MPTPAPATWKAARCQVHWRQRPAAETSAWRRKEAVTFASTLARGILNCTKSMARCEPRREAGKSALMACKKGIGVGRPDRVTFSLSFRNRLRSILERLLAPAE